MDENTEKLMCFEVLLTTRVLAAMVTGGVSHADAHELLKDLLQASALLSKERLLETLQKESNDC